MKEKQCLMLNIISWNICTDVIRNILLVNLFKTEGKLILCQSRKKPFSSVKTQLYKAKLMKSSLSV